MKSIFVFSLFAILVCSQKNADAQNTVDTLIDAGGYRLHFHIIRGAGVPILFESGGGNDGTVWNQLLNPIAGITGATLITYDRAGFGKSEIDTNKHGILNGIKGLEIALKKLGYEGNIMLAAHSLGGFYATLYASRNPEKVKAAVLFDAAHMCFYNDKRVKATQAIIDRQVKSKKDPGNYYISMDFLNTIEVMRKAPFPLNIPVLDIVSDKTPFSDSTDIRDWKRCHQDFGESNPNRKGMIAYGTGHYIFEDNPALAVEAIVNEYALLVNDEERNRLFKRAFEYSFKAENDEKKADIAYYHSEEDINSWGYQLLRRGEKQKALEVFKLNTMLHPESFKVYYSEAYAYAQLGDEENAIKNYKHSLELNPQNSAAAEYIRQHETKK
ncbi:alpha/beta fold hydrolase [Mucilaginibacter sabulilitoris]|uniref:Alpha/beta fold hydrolase n=1 Tax=Mucilaginibacter sabulilitoris TaxID=1173583 RepID=A0ABZ0TWA4_9SPHI|nr:alpha/beta fold hydrolase [Mucilaginibacter sabulilitoris]WPU96333.1 alpha/beta fold hydrolase [Mucilaginibacter sabulilitoris]